jgi:hypothetical protein
MLVLSSEVRVEGLETLDYLDNLKNRERFTEQGDAIVFESEVSIFFYRNADCFQYPFSFYSYKYYVVLVSILFYEGGQSISQNTYQNCCSGP